MYFAPGVKNPYGLPFPAKKRGRKSDAVKLRESNHDLFESELLLALFDAKDQAVHAHDQAAQAQKALDDAYRAIYGSAAAPFLVPALAGARKGAAALLGKPIRDLLPLSAADSEK